jgi:thymidylate kinase/thymidylate synthase ThyX
MQQEGLFIVIEGSDGSGKGTQFKLLVERLKSEGYEVSTYDFPQYEKESSYFVRQYLNGNYGSAKELGPYTPSLFYALDRYSAAHDIQRDLAAGKVVVSNRFSGSNMAHQGTKFYTDEERGIFFKWLDQLEFGMLGIPKPDMNIVLLVPAETAQKLVDQKESRSYTNQTRDIHEADLDHLKMAVKVYQQLCRTFPENFNAIDCTENGELMSIPTINNLIWEKVDPMVKKIRKTSARTAAHATKKQKAAPLTNELVVKNDNGSYSITKAGEAYLAEAVTNTDKPVYVFTDKISNATIAAAMARLSRRGDDMRVTILDEFSGESGKDEGLLKRVITAYGDDSVQQLTGIHFVVEGASNLLTKKLEWGRLAAYLEQSTRYIFFDQKDEHGKYKYYTPTTLDDETTDLFNKKLDNLFDTYSELVHKLTEFVRNTSDVKKEDQDGAWRSATKAQACDAIRPVLPVATKSTVGIFASGQALESLIMHLHSDELQEAKDTGNLLLKEARKVVPTFLERADKPDRGGAWIAYHANTKAKVAEIASSRALQPMKGEDREAVMLTDFWPKNELDLLPHVLYEQSTMGLTELRNEVDSWSYTDKRQAMLAYIGERLNRRHKPGRAFEIAHYNFDLICDYGIFRDLQRHRMVDALEWQQLSPHYGYDIPKLVTEAGLEDDFEGCFDLSMELYQTLWDRGYTFEAQYATLLGHKMRWKMMLNAREAYHFMELRTSPQGHPGYRKLAKQMYDKIAEVHPLIAENMTFVNKGEDPGLTRLAAERATQYKLSQLDQN